MVLGMSLLSISYIGLAYVNDVAQVYFLYAMIGIALGIASPAKNTLFSAGVNKDKASFVWSVLDAGVFLSMALAAIIAGAIVGKYGFRTLFFIAAFINMTGIVPYFLYIRHKRKDISLPKLSFDILNK